MGEEASTANMEANKASDEVAAVREEAAEAKAALAALNAAVVSKDAELALALEMAAKAQAEKQRLEGVLCRMEQEAKAKVELDAAMAAQAAHHQESQTDPVQEKDAVSVVLRVEAITSHNEDSRESQAVQMEAAQEEKSAITFTCAADVTESPISLALEDVKVSLPALVGVDDDRQRQTGAPASPSAASASSSEEEVTVDLDDEIAEMLEGEEKDALASDVTADAPSADVTSPSLAMRLTLRADAAVDRLEAQRKGEAIVADLDHWDSLEDLRRFACELYHRGFLPHKAQQQKEASGKAQSTAEAVQRWPPAESVELAAADLRVVVLSTSAGLCVVDKETASRLRLSPAASSSVATPAAGLIYESAHLQSVELAAYHYLDVYRTHGLSERLALLDAAYRAAAAWRARRVAAAEAEAEAELARKASGPLPFPDGWKTEEELRAPSTKMYHLQAELESKGLCPKGRTKEMLIQRLLEAARAAAEDVARAAKGGEDVVTMQTQRKGELLSMANTMMTEDGSYDYGEIFAPSAAAITEAAPAERPLRRSPRRRQQQDDGKDQLQQARQVLGEVQRGSEAVNGEQKSGARRPRGKRLQSARAFERGWQDMYACDSAVLER